MPWKEELDDDMFVFETCNLTQDTEILYFYAKNVVWTEDKVSHS
jgi:hypothetical protein